MFSSLKNIYFIEKLIEASLLLTFVAAPLLFGSGHLLVYTGLQILILFAFFLYGLREVLIRSYLTQCQTTEEQDTVHTWLTRSSFRSFFSNHPFVIPFVLWLGLIIIQIIPLPLSVLEAVSSRAYEL